MLGEYQELHKKSNTATKVVLEMIKAGPVFKERLTAYVRPQVIKGVSSLVNELRSLYSDSEKTKILGEILNSMCQSMENEMVLHPDDEEEQDPTVQMWLYCFMSQHNLRLGNIDEALSFINKAIEHTPTVVELYLVKAKIFQFGGNRK